MYYLTNAFSVNMLTNEHAHTVEFHPISLDVAKMMLAEGFTSAIGHPATAAVLTTQLGIDVPFRRQSIDFPRAGEMMVAQATIPRLAEGQILSEEEMQQIPIQFWYLRSDSDSPEDPGF